MPPRSRDLALIGLTAWCATLVVVGVVLLTLHEKVEPVAALGALAGVATLGGVALGRLSGTGPATPAA